MSIRISSIFLSRLSENTSHREPLPAQDVLKQSRVSFKRKVELIPLNKNLGGSKQLRDLDWVPVASHLPEQMLQFPHSPGDTYPRDSAEERERERGGEGGRERGREGGGGGERRREGGREGERDRDRDRQ